MKTRTGSLLVPLGILSLVALPAGCLSSAHRISKGELQRLAQTPPQQRGQHVRVVQAFYGETVPAAEPVSSTTVVVVDGGPHHHEHHYHGGGGGGPHPGGGQPSGGIKSGGVAKNASKDAKAWLIAAGIVAAALAFTEGTRFDGWVDLHPMMPVHMFGPYGQYEVVPLAQLTPEMAAWAQKAFVRPEEGPWTHAERAPLNRTGWTYSLLLGSATIPSGQELRYSEDRGTSYSPEAGFMGHIQIGRFVSQTTGVLLDFGMGWRTNQFQNSVYESRNAVEIQLLPLQAGAIHMGGYGQVGLGLRAEDGTYTDIVRRTFIGGAGLLGQLALTTRLTITGRVGYTRIFGENTAEAGIGVSIY